jgi:hypothetical protein
VPNALSSATPIRRLQAALALALLLVLAWGALAPLSYPTRERILDLSAGRAPVQVRLTLGVRDVLLLKNRGRSAHVFGAVRVAPGHAVGLPFEQAGVFTYACDAAPDGRVVVRVDPYPDPGWERLAWRADAFADALRATPHQRPAP